MEHAVVQVLLLLLVAAVVGMGARRARLPYTLALVVAGVVLGLFHFETLADLHLTPELLLTTLLPALLFEAAYHVDFSSFRKELPTILTLAVVGVVLAVAVTAGASYGLLRAVGVDFSFEHALLLGTVIAATDPISVLALFRTLGVQKRLYLLVEGESLLNDGVAVVAFLIVAAVLGVETGHGHAPHLESASEIAVYGIRTFLWMAGGGVAIGAAGGALASVLTRGVDDRLIEITVSFVLAYGSFIVAEELHASGVLSCVTAGVVLGSFGSRFGMSVATRVAVIDFWEVMAFFANSFVFLLVGIELDAPALLGNAGLVALVFVAVLLGRAAAVYGLVPVGRLLGGRDVPMSWRHVMWWGGLKGSLSMVLVIGLPRAMPGRDLLLMLVFGVVAVSLFAQGLTMKPLLSRLGLAGKGVVHADFERARARALMAAQALEVIDRDRHHDPALAAAADRLRAWYAKRRQEAQDEARAQAGPELPALRAVEQALHLLTVEEEALRHAISDGVIDAEAAAPVLEELYARREQLSHAHDDPAHADATLRALLGEPGAVVAEGADRADEEA